MKPQRAAPLTAPLIYADRLFPADFATRAVARRLYAEVRDLPIVSPHGHTDPCWYAEDAPFPDPARLFVTPDHYIFRMLYSQGVTLEEMGIPRKDGGTIETDARKIWRKFAQHYYLFRGTPTRLWLDQAFAELFGMTVRLSAQTADEYFDRISECLGKPEFRPRALFERFKIEVIATTESPLDPLDHHKKISESGWKGRVVTAYRPDPVVDPEFDGFKANIETFGNLTRCDTFSWHGYLEAHRQREAVRLPHALPLIFGGMKISITLAVIGIVVAEFVAAQRGIGYLIVMANGLLDTPLMMAAIAVLSAMGLALYGLVVALERVVVYWHVPAETTASGTP